VNNSIQWYEVLWVVFAAVGFVFWLLNARTARKSLKAATAFHIGNGRLTWARFSLTLTIVFAAIEFVFLLVGFNAMLREPTPTTAASATRVLTLIGFLAVSFAITYLAREWREVDKYLVASALERQNKLLSDDMDDRNGPPTNPDGIKIR
jgi:hypothetical protein